jgi:hypothetical protein
MSFVNGKLVNINVGAISGSLTEDEVHTLMEECGCTTKDSKCSGVAGECTAMYQRSCNAETCKDNKGATVVELGDLLEAAPPHARQHFLESLAFEKGKLTRVDHSVVKKHLPEATTAQLPRVLAE